MKKVVFAALLLTNSYLMAQSPSSCKDFEGKWDGIKSGAGYQGPITINFQADCKYEWVGSAGPITSGFLALKTDEIWYTNQAGSRGKVKRNGSELIWENVWTGNNYEVKVTKASQ